MSIEPVQKSFDGIRLFLMVFGGSSNEPPVKGIVARPRRSAATTPSSSLLAEDPSQDNLGSRRRIPGQVLIKLITTVFYIGFIPRIPGTAASITAFLIFYFFRRHEMFLLLLTFISGALGFSLCGKAEKLFGAKDAKPIVIDEFFAMLSALMFVNSTPFFLLLTFITFRAMDISKPWPIKKIEKLGGSKGIMLDDCIAAAYTVAVIQGITFFCK